MPTSRPLATRERGRQDVQRLRFGALLLAALVAGPTGAQNGGIAGVVRDTSGGVMPGVTVEAASPALIEKVEPSSPTLTGKYKIINLRPGTYTVTFHSSASNHQARRRRDHQRLHRQINADLKVGGIEETITVSGQSPLIDTQSVTQRKSLTTEMIDALPTGRSFQNLSVLVPGVIIL